MAEVGFHGKPKNQNKLYNVIKSMDTKWIFDNICSSKLPEEKDKAVPEGEWLSLSQTGE